MAESCDDESIFLTQNTFRSAKDESYDTDSVIDAILYMEGDNEKRDNYDNDYLECLSDISNEEILHITQCMEDTKSVTKSVTDIPLGATEVPTDRFRSPITDQEAKILGQKRYVIMHIRVENWKWGIIIILLELAED